MSVRRYVAVLGLVLSASALAPITAVGSGPESGDLDRLALDRPPRGTERIDSTLRALVDGPPGQDRVRVEVLPMDGAGDRIPGVLRAAGASDVKGVGHLFAAEVPVVALVGMGRHPDIRWVRSESRPTPLAVAGEGVGFIEADLWQTDGYTGSGVKVAVIDVGFSGYADLLGTELPAAVTPQNYCGSFTGDEHGTAVAEIVHEVAPDAELYLICIDDVIDMYFAVDFAIAEGIDVINTSLGWKDVGRGDGSGWLEPPISAARDAGILWVGSAGNSGSRHWGGTYSDTDFDDFHNFIGGDETNHVFLANGGALDVVLRWDDWGSTGYDYDLWLMNDALTVIEAWSIDDQNNGAPPVERITVVNTGPSAYFHIVVDRYSTPSAPVAIDLFFDFVNTIEYLTATRSILDPATSPEVFSVGAVHVGTGALESYSSQGPTISGVLKPDVAGPARVSGDTYGAGGFAGTSASSPHVAGAAALLLSRDPSLTPDGLTDELRDLGVDAGAAGVDDAFGWGILRMDAPPGFVHRYAGGNRYSTAALISAKDFPDPSLVSRVFIATGSNFPDGLAGAAVAARLGAPLLLVGPSLPVETAAELARLEPEEIVILGGTGVVSDAIESDLSAFAPIITRLAGSNRFDTAVAVSQYGFPGHADVVFVATGFGFADALAAGPAAVQLGGPVLLSPPGSLPVSVANEIVRLQPSTIVVVGGEGALSAAVFDGLQDLQPVDTVIRISGSNRYDTAVKLSEYAFSAADRVYVATGLNFPDALSGAAAAGMMSAPVLLVAGTTLPAYVGAEVADLGADTAIILGGTAVVGTQVEDALSALLGID